MEIKLFWSESSGKTIPVCQTDVFSEDGTDILGCLLMDDGGLPEESTFKWVEEGLIRVSAVLSKSEDSQDWNRESWGAIISSTNVQVYSLLDKSCSVLLDINTFNTALQEWQGFIESKERTKEVKHVVSH